MIEAINLHKTYLVGGQEVRALRGISLVLPPGSFNFFLGPSGSGKSTLLHLVGALDKPTQGQVIIEGNNLAEMNDLELSLFRRKKIGFIFQTFNLIQYLTVLENVLIPLIPGGVKTNDLNRAKDFLVQLGLGDRLHHKANQLSGGEGQRVAIARALLKEPLLVLADEPTGELDSVNAREIFGQMRKMNKTHGTTFIVVTHNTGFIQEEDITYQIRDGAIATQPEGNH